MSIDPYEGIRSRGPETDINENHSVARNRVARSRVGRNRNTQRRLLDGLGLPSDPLGDGLEDLKIVRRIVDRKKKEQMNTSDELSVPPGRTRRPRDNERDETASGPEQMSKKANLIFSISRYLKSERFGEFLKKQGKRFTEKQLSDMSIDGLELELETLELLISKRGSSDYISGVVKSAMMLSESFASEITKFKVNGLTSELFSDDHFLDLFEKVKIKNSLPTIKMSPMVELVLTIFQKAVSIHNRNNLVSSVASHTGPEVHGELTKSVTVSPDDEISIDIDIPEELSRGDTSSQTYLTWDDLMRDGADVVGTSLACDHPESCPSDFTPQ